MLVDISRRGYELIDIKSLHLFLVIIALILLTPQLEQMRRADFGGMGQSAVMMEEVGI